MKKTGFFTTDIDSKDILIGDKLVVMDGSSTHGTVTITLKGDIPMVDGDETLEVFMEECLNEGFNLLRVLQ